MGLYWYSFVCQFCEVFNSNKSQLQMNLGLCSRSCFRDGRASLDDFVFTLTAIFLLLTGYLFEEIVRFFERIRLYPFEMAQRSLIYVCFVSCIFNTFDAASPMLWAHGRTQRPAK